MSDAPRKEDARLEEFRRDYAEQLEAKDAEVTRLRVIIAEMELVANERREAAEQENERLREAAEFAGVPAWTRLFQRAKDAESALADTRKALRWYAIEGNEDKGRRARGALAAGEGTAPSQPNQTGVTPWGVGLAPSEGTVPSEEQA